MLTVFCQFPYVHTAVIFDATDVKYMRIKRLVLHNNQQTSSWSITLMVVILHEETIHINYIIIPACMPVFTNNVNSYALNSKHFVGN